MSPHDSKDWRAQLREHLQRAIPEALQRLKNAEKRGRRKERPPSRAGLLRTMRGTFSIVRKRIKGRAYFYLREQCRRAGRLLQRDRFLGRMGFDALPVWLKEIYKGDPSAFEFRADAPDTLGAALEWWGRIHIIGENVFRKRVKGRDYFYLRVLAPGAGRFRPLTQRDARFLQSARGNIAALKFAQARNKRERAHPPPQDHRLFDILEAARKARAPK